MPLNNEAANSGWRRTTESNLPQQFLLGKRERLRQRGCSRPEENFFGEPHTAWQSITLIESCYFLILRNEKMHEEIVRDQLGEFAYFARLFTMCTEMARDSLWQRTTWNSMNSTHAIEDARVTVWRTGKGCQRKPRESVRTSVRGSIRGA